jgi:ornithine carbamoyltransferase
MRHLLSISDLKSGELERIFAIGEDLKSKCAEGLREPLLPGRVMALLFEKPSLRTRVSFESGMAHLGGATLDSSVTASRSFLGPRRASFARQAIAG